MFRLRPRTAIALATSTVLLTVCGGSTPPPPAEKPKVALSPVPREIIGTQLTVTVEVTGCIEVARVWVTTQDSVLAELQSGS
ncbi:MAG: hypothetical protein HY901_25995, partial [Deltaproteobacteria bacterium]|nr:hypothetical protein [Deltaproteobacteria bacterium]